MSQEDEDIRFATCMGLIGNAYRMLKLVEPDKLLTDIERGIDRSYFLDPTLALRVHRQQNDIDRKLRMLRAATLFVAELDAVAGELVEAQR